VLKSNTIIAGHFGPLHARSRGELTGDSGATPDEYAMGSAEEYKNPAGPEAGAQTTIDYHQDSKV